MIIKEKTCVKSNELLQKNKGKMRKMKKNFQSFAPKEYVWQFRNYNYENSYNPNLLKD